MGCGKLLSSSFACTRKPGHWLRRQQLPLDTTCVLQLLKDLTAYVDVKRVVAKADLTKLQRHLWYLSEELVALLLFDPWSRWTRRGKCSPHVTPK